MKTIIWKELRENLKWSVLALLSLTLAEIVTLSEQRASEGSSSTDLTLCSSAFLMVTSLGCSFIGAALGAIQILPELRKDQWAALLHRPVPRRVIFFGKVGAGLLLYLLATVPPLLASIAYAAAPAQFPAPLVPGMILPAASDLFLGVVFYFAALLISLSRGPWYGRRGLLAFFLLPVFFFHMTSKWIFLVPIGASLVLMTAACGAMMSNGLAGDRTKAGRFSFVLVALVAVESVVLLVDGGLSLLSTALRDESEPGYRDLELTKDGQILVQTYGKDGSVTSVTDIQGKPVTDERYIGNDNGHTLYRFTNICSDFPKNRQFLTAYLAENPRDLRNYVEWTNWNTTDSENWFQIASQNYFVGYDKLSRRRIGICDREGFHPPGARPKPFSDRPQSAAWDTGQMHFYWSDGKLYGLDFAERVMTPLFNAGSERNHGSEALGPQPGKALFLVVALEKNLRLLDLHGAPLLTIPYSHDPRIWSQIAVGTIPGGELIFVRYDADYDASKPMEARTPSFVDEIDIKGNLLHSYTVQANGSIPTPTGWAEDVTTFTLPSGPVALCTIAARMIPSKGEVAIYSDDSDYRPPSPEIPLSLLATLSGISAALAIGALLWARNAGFPEGEARRWAAFVFCFGLPGFITFRLAADWPTRVRCPKCSGKRPVESNECPQCREAWAPPERNGAEIFDAATNPQRGADF